MEIFALVGKSGTGKSYKAQYVAGEYGIEYIVDDGLLIRGNQVIAGRSAKREDTRIAAIKRAIFNEENHRKEVIGALENNDIKKLLIIGTSENMIKTIIKELGLDEYYNLIKIEDISTHEEIEEALKSRRIKGKHVIPVPTFSIKKHFSGYFIDSLRNRRKIGDRYELEGYENYYEKTVVRPTFSYLGNYDIKDSVLKSIIKISTVGCEGLDKVTLIDIYSMKEGVVITIVVILKLGEKLKVTAENIRDNIIKNFEYMTGINVLQLNIKIKGIKGFGR